VTGCGSARPPASRPCSIRPRAARTPWGGVPTVRIVPSASSPHRRSDRGPVAPASTAGAGEGGQSSATRSRRTYLPSALTSSPRSSARSARRYSRSSVTGDSTRAPTWPIQSCTPCPTPTTRRPGNMRSRVATSIAVSATLRSGIGSSPTPTRNVSVQASAAAAAATPLSRKQSSHSHSSSSPASSATRATARRRSGGSWGRNTAPRIVMRGSSHPPSTPPAQREHRPTRSRTSP
jgi:hypothetical protein